jgi:hypothetical protein
MERVEVGARVVVTALAGGAFDQAGAWVRNGQDGIVTHRLEDGHVRVECKDVAVDGSSLKRKTCVLDLARWNLRAATPEEIERWEHMVLA